MPDLRQECKDTIEARLGRKLTPKESQEIIPALRAQMAMLRRADPVRWDGMSKDDRIMAAAERVAKNLEEHAQQLRYRAQLSLIAAANTQTLYKNNADRGLYGYRSLGNILESTYTYIQGLQQQYFSRFANELKKAMDPKFFGIFEDRANAFALVQELHGEDSGNALAKRAAGVISKMFEAMRVRFNRAGGDVGLLEDWALPQSHDADKIVRAANRLSGQAMKKFTSEQQQEAWVRFIFDKLDRERYVDENTGELLNDTQMWNMLKEVWTTLVTDGNGDHYGSRVTMASSSRANRYGQHRSLHFKDAASYFEYNQKFGSGSIMETITSRVRSMSKDIGLLEMLGPNPTNTFQTLHQIAGQDLDRARKDLSTWTRSWMYRDLNGALGVTTTQMWNVLSGEAARPAGTGRLAAAGAGVRNLQIAGKLGSAFITSLSDIPSYFVALGVNRISPLTSTFSIVSALSKQDIEFAARAGILAEAVNSALGKWSTENLGRGWTGILADATIRLSLLNAWTEAVRRAFSLNLMAATGKLVQSTRWDQLDNYDRVRFSRHGITESDWLVMRLATPETYKKCSMLTRGSLEAIPETTLAMYGLTVADRDRAIARWLSMLQDESYMASIDPDLATRTGSSRGTQAGTVSGELWRSVMLFKSFPFAMLTRHWSRGQDLWTSGNEAGAVGYAASIIVGTTIFGAISLQIANLVAGRDMQDMDPMNNPEFWGQALMKGGGLGIFGDMLYNGVFAEGTYGSPNVLSFLGPVAGSAMDTWDVAKSYLVDEGLYDKETKAGMKALRLVRGNTPFLNVWYAKAVLDHAVFNDLNEMLSPGYLRRQRNRAMRSQGQGYWWSQQEMFPERAPEFATAPSR